MPTRTLSLKNAKDQEKLELLKLKVDDKKAGFTPAGVMLLKHHGAETVGGACLLPKKTLEKGPVAHPEKVAEGIERRLEAKGLRIGSVFTDALRRELGLPLIENEPAEPGGTPPPPHEPQTTEPKEDRAKMKREPPSTLPEVTADDFAELEKKLRSRIAFRQARVEEISVEARELENANLADTEALAQIEEARGKITNRK